MSTAHHSRRRRRSEDEEHVNHERWLISYADFITLLFAFFVVMYAISSVNEGRYRVLSNALSTAFGRFRGDPQSSLTVPALPGTTVPAVRTPRRADSAPAAPDQKRVEHMKNIADRLSKVLAPLVSKGEVRVTNGARGVAIEINAAVLFASGQAELQPSSGEVIKSVAAVLAAIDDPVQVEGHTDSIPIATSQFPSNWELSTARAGSVVRFFVEHGVPPQRLSAAGYGEFHPVESNDTPEGRARNRRVTLMILTPDDKRENLEQLNAAKPDEISEPNPQLPDAASGVAATPTEGRNRDAAPR